MDGSSCFFFFQQKTAYEIMSDDWSSDVFSSDLKGISKISEIFLRNSPNVIKAVTSSFVDLFFGIKVTNILYF